MAASPLFYIDIVGVRTINIMHHATQVARWRLYDQVVMIAHKHITVKQIPILFLRFLQIGLEFFIICLAVIYPSSLISPGGYMVKGPFIFNP
jgi:hypothetical protein